MDYIIKLIGKMIYRKDAEIVERIQVYIPSLVDSLDFDAFRKQGNVRIIGRRMGYVKYIVESSTPSIAQIPMIVTEDFVIYDLHINFLRNTLSFIIEGEEEPNNQEVLDKIFKLFLIKFSSTKIGFFTYSKRREEHKNRIVVN